MKRYNPNEIEPKWQQIWDEQQVYKTDLHSDKPKYVAMSMFNYPSGAGIHIGHAMNYTISDVKARFKRQLGHESYHPVGWDAFGLPAENYAIKAGVSPQESMASIIPGYHKQYKAMGWSNDWSKEIATHTPEYYKWTQWIFSQMYKHGLAYQDSRMQWWCEKCQTVLANEQIVDGKCWRHDGPDDPIVEQKEVKQWFFKITEYADELLEAIDDLDWTESVKLAQKNWIGRSKGAEVNFAIEGSDQKITVFTTRPDTLFGATFLVLAPEHELVESLVADGSQSEVEAYVKAAQKKTEVERQAGKEKTGVFTGSYAINPANGEKLPIWIADYVLTGYGTGAIMAVPAHDERDKEFAEKFGIEIRQVIAERFIHAGNEHQQQSPVVPREVVCAVVEHPTEKKFLIARPNGSDFWAPVMGGIDEGESAEQAGARELLEESGYNDIVEVQPYSEVLASEFYAQHKQENRIAYINVVRIKLASLQAVDISAEEQNAQEVMWATTEQVAELCVGAGASEIYRIAAGGERDMVLEGRMINSGEYNGLTSAEAREKVVEDLAKKDTAGWKTNYKMRDWSVSRQRYWGAPIPIINCPEHGPVLVPDDQLPVVLPVLDDFKPAGDGRSALGRAQDWLHVECPECGRAAERETDTLDTYICSSWYMLRYIDPFNESAIFDTDLANKWMPIDFYNGGDHATAHMLYARFVTRFFHKLGLVNNPEPFKQFLFNGKVTAQNGEMFSKSKGNGVDPLEIINSGYGADALRMYLMFAAPLEVWAKWDPQGVPGTHRFLSRVWTLTQEYSQADSGEVTDEIQRAIRRSSHTMIKKVTEDIEENRYNTAIAAAMGHVNDLYKLWPQAKVKNAVWQETLDALVACIAPFAPHIADELWQQLGHSRTVQKDSWPAFNNQYLQTDEITLAVQINGKLRGEINVPATAQKDDIFAIATADEKIAGHLAESQIKKSIYVPGRLVNFVI